MIPSPSSSSISGISNTRDSFANNPYLSNAPASPSTGSNSSLESSLSNSATSANNTSNINISSNITIVNGNSNNRGGKDASLTSTSVNAGSTSSLDGSSAIKGSSVLCSLHVHTDTYSKEDVILNRDVFPNVLIGDYIRIYRQDAPKAKLVVKVSVFHTTGGRLEVSLSKTLADVLQVKSIATKVVVEKVSIEEATINFVELSFKGQFLQRGNMWRFKHSMIGRPIHAGQNLSVDGVIAQVQDVGQDGVSVLSGIILEHTTVIFRSRSTRIFWLVQISREMWEYDDKGDLYFEKFLNKFVGPIFDRWKSLTVTHSLTVVYYARSIIASKADSIVSPELASKLSFYKREDGSLQDFYKIVIENATDFEKSKHFNKLKAEFLNFPRLVGWNIPGVTDLHDNSYSSRNNYTPISVPSMAYDGNFLEAINTTLNVLDKHYMDRALNQTGNAIVMISAGTGCFKVKPILSQITKQRMMDTGIGIDFVSLSQPPLHVVPLFHVDCSDEIESDIPPFYESPHWMNVSYVDCKKDGSIHLEGSLAQDPSTVSASSLLALSADLDRFGMAFKPIPFSDIIKGHFILNTDESIRSKFNSSRFDGSILNFRPDVTLPRTLYRHLSYVMKQESRELPLELRDDIYESNLSNSEDHSQKDTVRPRSISRTRGGDNIDIPIWGMIYPMRDYVKHLYLDPTRSEEERQQLNSWLSHYYDLGSYSRDIEYVELLRAMPRYRSVSDDCSSDIGAMSVQTPYTNNVFGGSLYNINHSMSPMHTDMKTHSSSIISSSKDNLHVVDRISPHSSSLPNSHSGMDDRLTLSMSYYTPPMRYSNSQTHINAELNPIEDILSGNIESISSIDPSKLAAMFEAHDTSISSPYQGKSMHHQLNKASPIRLNNSQANISFDNLGELPSALSSSPKQTTHSLGGHAALPLPDLKTRRGSVEKNQQQYVNQSQQQQFVVGSLSSLMSVSGLGMGGPFMPGISVAHLTSSSNNANMDSLPAISEDDSNIISQSPKGASKLSHMMSPTISKNGLNSNNSQKSTNYTSSSPQISRSFEEQKGSFMLTNANLNSNNFMRKTALSKASLATRPNVVPLKAGHSLMSGSTSSVRNRSRSHDVENGEHLLATISETSNYSGNWISGNSNIATSALSNHAGNSSSLVDVPSLDSTAQSNSNYNLANNKHIHDNSVATNPSQNNASFSHLNPNHEDPNGVLREYRKKSQTNPFRMADEDSDVKTHNRRRWSHVFPTESSKQILFNSSFFGPNWKSLSQPAILPLTTDFLPSDSDIKNNYSVNTNYTLVPDYGNDCPFNSPEGVMKEIVCQRLSTEFQLVEGVDVTSYSEFKSRLTTLNTSKTSDKKSLLTKNIKTKENPQLIYILTMGHRIQLLEYDWLKNCVNVTQWRSNQGVNDKARIYTTSYELWVPQLEQFQTVTQTFSQFSAIEFNWNKADNILMGSGEIDFAGDSTKTKRLRFVIIPEIAKSQSFPADEDRYFHKLGLLIQFFNKYCDASYGDQVKVVEEREEFNPSTFPTYENSEGSAVIEGGAAKAKDDTSARTGKTVVKGSKAYSHNIVKIWLRGPKHDNPKWAFLKYDSKASVRRVFHIELHWLACDSWLMDDFVNLIYRRCSSKEWSLRITQVPEFFCTANLNVHPFRAQPYIAVYQSSIATQKGYTSSTDMIKKLFFHGSLNDVIVQKCKKFQRGSEENWIEDDERLTDWGSLGSACSQEVSALSLLQSSKKRFGFASVNNGSNSSLNNASQANEQNTAASGILNSIKQKQQARLDTQYLHRQGIASVRVGAKGLVWLLNSNARVNDVNLTPVEKGELVKSTLDTLISMCEAVSVCYDILLDVIENSIKEETVQLWDSTKMANAKVREDTS